MTSLEKTTHDHSEIRARDAHDGHTGGSAAQLRRFVWHFVQMVLAMEVGMAVYHLLAYEALAAYPVLQYAGMELSMILPMVALMLYQRHGWRYSAEMTGAMVVGPVVFLACAQFGLHNYIPGLSRETLLVFSDATMYLGMLGWMLYRRDHYTRGAGHSAHAT